MLPPKHSFIRVISACSDCTECSDSSTLVVFENVLVFYLILPFSQVQARISFCFFQKLMLLVLPVVVIFSPK